MPVAGIPKKIELFLPPLRLQPTPEPPLDAKRFRVSVTTRRPDPERGDPVAIITGSFSVVDGRRLLVYDEQGRMVGSEAVVEERDDCLAAARRVLLKKSDHVAAGDPVPFRRSSQLT